MVPSSEHSRVVKIHRDSKSRNDATSDIFEVIPQTSFQERKRWEIVSSQLCCDEVAEDREGSFRFGSDLVLWNTEL